MQSFDTCIAKPRGDSNGEEEGTDDKQKIPGSFLAAGR